MSVKPWPPSAILFLCRGEGESIGIVEGALDIPGIEQLPGTSASLPDRLFRPMFLALKVSASQIMSSILLLKYAVCLFVAVLLLFVVVDVRKSAVLALVVVATVGLCSQASQQWLERGNRVTKRQRSLAAAAVAPWKATNATIEAGNDDGDDDRRQ
jgi:hypothetical protein